MATQQPPHLSPKQGIVRRIRSTLAQFIAPTPPLSVVPSNNGRGSGIQASSNAPYLSGSTGRRSLNWQPTRLGPNTSLTGSLEQIRARSRDMIRNNPWAASAIDNFESQVIGKGIRPRWNLPDNPDLKRKIEKEWDLWTKRCDYNQRSGFYGMQATVAREFFEAGEVFVRYQVRTKAFMESAKLRVPLQLQLLESEQLPIYVNSAPSKAPVNDVPVGNSIRSGIEFDPQGRRTAYHMYRQHPGDTMFFPMDGLSPIRIPASEMLHVYKASRAGLLRGEPKLTSVLTLLYELDQYTDAELDRKKIQTMFAGFIETPVPDGDVLPLGPDQLSDLGVAISKIESGTMQELRPGEKISFPQLPADQTIEQFLRVMLHEFATGIGATYEQVTGDLRGVNYSSIRAGLVDFRRKCEQLQTNIFIFQFLEPIVERWLDEAVMIGALSLPGYASDPNLYLDLTWATSGWDWVDPKADVDSEQTAIRGGLDTRANLLAKRGLDIIDVDRENEADNARMDGMGLVYDTDPRKILIGREANPTVTEEDGPKAADQESKLVPAGSGPAGPKPAQKAAPKPAPKKKAAEKVAERMVSSGD